MIYHGTPMTPRAALLDVCAGRAMCVSFYRPDDVEAVEAISPAVMFRQRGVFVLEGGIAQRAGMGRDAARLVSLLRVAGTSPISSRSLGSDTRHTGRAKPAQRCAAERMAVRAEGSAPVAHGWANRAAIAAVRSIRPGLLGVDRRGQVARHARLSRADGGSRQGARQSVAGSSHDARNAGGVRLPVHQRGQHFISTERLAL